MKAQLKLALIFSLLFFVPVTLFCSGTAETQLPFSILVFIMTSNDFSQQMRTSQHVSTELLIAVKNFLQDNPPIATRNQPLPCTFYRPGHAVSHATLPPVCTPRSNQRTTSSSPAADVNMLSASEGSPPSNRGWISTESRVTYLVPEDSGEPTQPSHASTSAQPQAMQKTSSLSGLNLLQEPPPEGLSTSGPACNCECGSYLTVCKPIKLESLPHPSSARSQTEQATSWLSGLQLSQGRRESFNSSGPGCNYDS